MLNGKSNVHQDRTRFRPGYVLSQFNHLVNESALFCSLRLEVDYCARLVRVLNDYLKLFT
jgi:hypothetical protein